MMKEFLDRIFKLPPVEERRMPSAERLETWFGKAITSPSKDDEYILYLQFKYRILIGYALAAFLCASYWVPFSCAIGGIEFCVKPEGYFVGSFVFRFAYIFLFLEAAFIFPYFYCLLRRHVDWNVPFAWHRELSEGSIQERRRNLKRAQKLGRFFGFLLYVGSPAFGLFWLNRGGGYGSESYLIGMALLLPIMTGFIWSFLFIGAMIRWRAANFLKQHNINGEKTDELQ